MKGSKMKFIGLGGEIGSGKDTVADILCRDYEFSRISVGSHIRRELLDLDYRHDESIPTQLHAALERVMDEGIKALNKKPTPLDIRICLQWFGQREYEIDEDHWLALVRQDINRLEREGNRRIVLTDIRRLNEFELAGILGTTWGVMRTVDREPTPASKHTTEVITRCLPYQFYIANNGTLPDLTKLVHTLVEAYDLA